MDDEIPLQRGSHASSSHEVSSEPTPKRRESGPKLQGLRAEDAMAKPHLELTILVT